MTNYKETKNYIESHETGNRKDTPQDIGKFIQTEIAKCMETQMHQQSGQKNAANMIQYNLKRNKPFDGHFAFNVLPNMKKTTWIIDSWASSHICCNPDLLHTTYKLDSPIVIYLPDGTSKSVAYAGMARVSKEITLINVLIVCSRLHPQYVV